ncbi:RNA polymerase sigma factor [Sunxiuqinia sp. A32]|uniref:RNA polymerase sigma factor n=1 Tax=Sunxiuqinia sp. A32 TaxID=3461496 RepID=UPI004045D459
MFGRTRKKLTDEILMQQITCGNQEAFNELYNRYQERLYYYFFRMLGNSSELANDFLQELFLKIIEKPERFNQSYCFSTWIFSVAHNMCKNEYRRQEVRKQAQMEIPVGSEEAHELSAVNREKLLEQIFESLNELKTEQRSAFLLFYREGFSIKEISEMLELPLGTVKSRMHYTRKFLESRFSHLKDEIEL